MLILRCVDPRRRFPHGGGPRPSRCWVAGLAVQTDGVPLPARGAAGDQGRSPGPAERARAFAISDGQPGRVRSASPCSRPCHGEPVMADRRFHLGPLVALRCCRHAGPNWTSRVPQIERSPALAGIVCMGVGTKVAAHADLSTATVVRMAITGGGSRPCTCPGAEEMHGSTWPSCAVQDLVPMLCGGGRVFHATLALHDYWRTSTCSGSASSWPHC